MFREVWEFPMAHPDAKTLGLKAGILHLFILIHECQIRVLATLLYLVNTSITSVFYSNQVGMQMSDEVISEQEQFIMSLISSF